MEDRPKREENAGHSLQKNTPKMRIEDNVRLKDMDIEWRVPWGQDGQKTHVGKPHRIRQTESQSDQSKTVPHDNQDIEAGTLEQSDAYQVGSSTAPDLRLGRVGVRSPIAPEETPSCGKHCVQDSGGRPMVRQKRGHPVRLEVHHRNHSENQLLREAVNYDLELEAPHKGLRYRVIINKFFFLFQIDENSGPTSQEEDHNSPRPSLRVTRILFSKSR